MRYEEKRVLRQQCKQRRDTLTERAGRSLAICEKVVEIAHYQSAQVLHCYLPMRSEVDTRPLILHALAHDRRVAVPVVQQGSRDLAHSWLFSLAEDEITTGIFGTPQPRELRPVHPGEWDCIIVPLLAFDRQGYRLGYGAGHYDRLLTMGSAHTIGVAFHVQEVEQVPCEEHDIPLNWIVTEREVIPMTRV